MAAIDTASAVSMPIDSLPNELVVRIVEEIKIPKNDSSPRAYAAISATSRRLHQIVAPYLYKEHRQTRSNSSIYFIRTLVENPELADLVKCLRCELEMYDGNESPGLPESMLLSIGDQKSLRPKINSLLGPISSQKWLDAIMEDDWERHEAHMACILRLCPNIEDFIFSGEPTWISADFEFLRWTGLFTSRQSLGAIPSPLLCPKSLQRLDMNCRLWFLDVITLFKIPSLRELHLHTVIASESQYLEFGANGYIEPHSSSVQHLRLTWCDVEDGPLLQMIKASRALTGFEFNIDHPGTIGHRTHHCPIKIVQALLTHKRTLETIRLVFNNSYPSYPDYVTALPAFEQFDVLHDLCIEGEIIFMESNKIIDFVNHLPQSIAAITILQGRLHYAQWSILQFVCCVGNGTE